MINNTRSKMVRLVCCDCSISFMKTHMNNFFDSLQK